MYKNILQQIANTIYINIQNVEHLGLLNGKFGIALFFYHYARFSGNKIYNELSDECIEFILGQINKNTPCFFSDGLSGIGWGVNYLIKNDFVEIEDDNILEDIDIAILEISVDNFMLDLDVDISLFSKGLYFTQRSVNIESIKISFLQCKHFLETSNNISLPITYLNSIVYLIVKMIHLNIEVNLCQQLLDRVYIYVTDLISKRNYVDLDIILLKKHIDQLGNKKESEKWKRILSNIDLNIPILDRGWINLIFHYEKALDDAVILKSDVEEILDNKLKDLEASDLSIYRGLAGLGIELMRISK